MSLHINVTFINHHRALAGLPGAHQLEANRRIISALTASMHRANIRVNFHAEVPMLRRSVEGRGFSPAVSALRCKGFSPGLLIAAAAISILALVAPASSTQAQQMRTFHCIAMSVAPGGGHNTMYVSQVFPMEISQHAAINGAWATYIKSTYHLTTISITRCDQLGVTPTMQERVLAAEETSWKNQGWEVVRVNWRPGQAGATPGSAASLYSASPNPPGIGEPHTPSAQPAAASGAGGPSASYCYSDDRKPTIYFSDAFDTAGLPSSAAWSTAFTKMLTQKYAYKGTVTCKTVSTIVSAQSAMRDQRDALQGKQFVDTDWTYEPPTPTPADK